ncbi:TetR/AcrR family transcriptional regulator [Leptospira stimsonii]|uniref:TetR/AcrR family transcriptional regulator n=1 Tax=Leptospira stimsonii TaxID=2202203 RepID=UPI00131423CE|nr:TetR/AcrR family transcriptional regulator [Leptospira stimsonii]
MNSKPDKKTAKEQILNTAIALFNEHGIHKTGIDRIIAESGVAKMSFYNNFSSKAKLISEYLRFKEEKRLDSLKRYTVDKSDDPLKQLLGIFDSLEEWYREPDFFGCPFIRGLSDFREDDHAELRKQVESHFQKVSDFIEERLGSLFPPTQVKKILPQFLSLYIGSTVMAIAGSPPEIAQSNKKLAMILLKSN